MKVIFKEEFTVVGKVKTFFNGTSVVDFWKETTGAFGICIDGRETFDYWIADLYDPTNDIPEGKTTCNIPAGLWAIIPCEEISPEAIQKAYWEGKLQIAAESEYEDDGNYSIEYYSDDGVEVWLPIKKK